MTEKNKSLSADKAHQQRMQRKKSVVDAGIASATDKRGVLIIHSGNGKGKSSAAFGVLARALGHNMRAAVIQFGKARTATGEELFFRQFIDQDYHVMGAGFTWETQDKAEDIKAARAAWKTACGYLENADFDLLILDELNIILKHQYLELDEVIRQLQQRPAMQHVVITGRGARPELIDIADTVSDIQNIKHAYKAGIAAQKGIEL